MSISIHCRRSRSSNNHECIDATNSRTSVPPLVFIAVVFVVSSVDAKSVIRGVVRDAITGESIPGAVVGLRDSGGAVMVRQVSRGNGEFAFTNPHGAAALAVHALGYRDTVIARVRDSFVVVALTPYPLQKKGVTVTAERYASAISDVPVSTAVMESADVQSRNPESLTDALQYIPGVTVQDNQVNIRGSSGYTYGVGSRVLIMMDGTPMLSADEGSASFRTLPMFDIDRIEVVKGPGSALYGTSALGGIINVITKTPDRDFHGALNVFSGMYSEPSYAQWLVPSLGRQFSTIDGEASGTVGSVGLLGSIDYTSDDSYRLGDDSYRWNAFVKGFIPISDATQLSVSTLLSHENREDWVFWQSLYRPLIPADSQNAMNARVHSYTADLIANMNAIVGDNGILNVKMNLFNTLYYTDPQISGDSAKGHSTAALWNGEGTYSVPVAQNLYCTAGINAAFEQVTSDQWGNHHAPLGAAFAQAVWKPAGDITVNAGLRADVQPFFNVFLVSPKLGMTYEPVENFVLRASYGKGFRTPTITEMFVSTILDSFNIEPNVNLRPEYSQSEELGANYRTPYMTLDGAVYYSTFTDLIEPEVVFSPDSGTFIQFQNVTKALLYGHEETIDVSPFGNELLHIQLGYTYVFPENSVTKQILPYRPRNVVQIGLMAEWNGIGASADFRYISKYEALDSLLATNVPNGNAAVDAYVVNAGVHYQLRTVGIPATLGIEALNLLNYYYVEAPGNLAPLRSVAVRLQTCW